MPDGRSAAEWLAGQASDCAAPDAIVKRLAWASRFAATHAPADTAPTQLAEAALGWRLTPATRTAVARAETRPEALALPLTWPNQMLHHAQEQRERRGGASGRHTGKRDGEPKPRRAGLVQCCR
jgi:hypothetical protein